MKLALVLLSQGFGARRECKGLVLARHVALAGEVCDDPFLDVEPQGLVFNVREEVWPYREKALVLLHKPSSCECSQKPSTTRA